MEKTKFGDLLVSLRNLLNLLNLPTSEIADTAEDSSLSFKQYFPIELLHRIYFFANPLKIRENSRCGCRLGNAIPGGKQSHRHILSSLYQKH